MNRPLTFTDAAHYEKIAYDSIAWTSPFSENLDVRLWFEAHGYAW